MLLKKRKVKESKLKTLCHIRSGISPEIRSQQHRASALRSESFRERGSDDSVVMPKSVLYIIQLRLPGYNCFRSDNHCLLLPYPKMPLSESELFITDVIVNILGLAGDVETSPGPPKSDTAMNILQKPQDGQAEILEKLTSIVNQQEKLEAKVGEQGLRLGAIEVPTSRRNQG